MHSITAVIIVDSHVSYLGKDMEYCILLASREPISCYLVFPRDIHQVIVPWKRSLLDPNDTGIINLLKFSIRPKNTKQGLVVCCNYKFGASQSIVP